MAPTKIGATYAIACLGPYDYNQYTGLGEYTGEIAGYHVEGESGYQDIYGFKISCEKDTCFFLESEVICEAKTSDETP